MANLTAVVAQLQQARNELQSELTRLEQAIRTLTNLDGGSGTGGRRAPRRMSAAARARIAAAQRARWAKWKRQKKAA
jgi:hypothetical protein